MPNPQEPDEGPAFSELAAADEKFGVLVQEFLNSLDRRLADLGSALSSSDYQRLRSLAHQLKGTGGGYGYPALSERAAELERLALAGEFDACRRSIEDLSTLMARLAVKAL
jgi:HPt (histidine-containing phosphotransfer) domain-containing protein